MSEHVRVTCHTRVCTHIAHPSAPSNTSRRGMLDVALINGPTTKTAGSVSGRWPTVVRCRDRPKPHRATKRLHARLIHTPMHMSTQMPTHMSTHMSTRCSHMCLCKCHRPSAGMCHFKTRQARPKSGSRWGEYPTVVSAETDHQIALPSVLNSSLPVKVKEMCA